MSTSPSEPSGCQTKIISSLLLCVAFIVRIKVTFPINPACFLLEVMSSLVFHTLDLLPSPLTLRALALFVVEEQSQQE